MSLAHAIHLFSLRDILSIATCWISFPPLQSNNRHFLLVTFSLLPSLLVTFPIAIVSASREEWTYIFMSSISVTAERICHLSFDAIFVCFHQPIALTPVFLWTCCPSHSTVGDTVGPRLISPIGTKDFSPLSLDNL